MDLKGPGPDGAMAVPATCTYGIAASHLVGALI